MRRFLVFATLLCAACGASDATVATDVGVPVTDTGDPAAGLEPGATQTQTPVVSPVVAGLAVSANEVAMTPTVASTTYPRLLLLANGNYLAAYTRLGASSNKVLEVSTSADGGHTFVTTGTITQSTGDLGNLFVVELPNNANAAHPPLLAAFRNHDVGADGNYTYFRITVTRSDDGGKSWTYVSQAAQKAAPWGLWEPFMRIGSAGEVQLTYGQATSNADENIMRVASFDQGKTWSTAAMAVGSNVTNFSGRNGIASSEDGNKPVLVMVFETSTLGGTSSVGHALSYDDGNNWSVGTTAYEPAAGHNAGGPQITSFADGSLAVAFMTDEDSAPSSATWPDNAAIKVMFAAPPKSGVLTWSSPQTVSPASSYWPGLAAVGPSQAWLGYDHGGVYGRLLTWAAAKN